jgi:hypothetical protein
MANFLNHVEKEIRRLSKDRDAIDRRIRSLEKVRQEYLKGEPHESSRAKTSAIIENRVQKIVSIIREAGKPMHYKDIVRKLEQVSGEDFTGVKDKEKTITATLSNYRDVFKRVARGVYALCESEESGKHESGEFS